jgi:hypothetical protein
MTLKQKPSMNLRDAARLCARCSGLAIGGGQFGYTHPEFVSFEKHQGIG